MKEDNAWRLLNRNLFFVKDMVKPHEAKTSDKFDVIDPQSGDIMLECREPDIAVKTKMKRFLGGEYNETAPFNLLATIPGSGEQVLRIARGSSFLIPGGSAIECSDHNDNPICRMKKPFFALSRVFRIFQDNNETLFLMRIKSVLNGYILLIDNKEVAQIMLNWKDKHDEVFKAGKCNYAISLSPEVQENNMLRQIILGIAISLNRVAK